MGLLRTISLIEESSTRDSDTIRALALGQSLIRARRDFNPDQVADDETFSNQLASLSSEFFIGNIELAKDTLEKEVAFAAGKVFSDMAEPLKENNRLTSENHRALNETYLQVSRIGQSVDKVEKNIENEPWAAISTKQFIVSVVGSIIASLIVSGIIAYVAFDNRLDNIDRLTDHVCSISPESCR